MGITKTDDYDAKLLAMAKLCKALGHPARLAIVTYLHTVNTCICGDLVLELPLSQATVSQHLKELKEAGLIKGTVEGNSVCYCLNPQSINEINAFFSHMNDTIHSSQLNKCC